MDTVGNFYVNLVLKADASHVLDALRSLRRTALVAAVPEQLAVVVDRQCEHQDLAQLETLAVTLSRRLECPVVSCVNHDDDALILALHRGGVLELQWGWRAWWAPQNVPRGSPERFVAAVRGALGTVPRPMVRHGVRGWLWTRFVAVAAHQQLAARTGLPPESVGAGYDYVQRGDVALRPGIRFVPA